MAQNKIKELRKNLNLTLRELKEKLSEFDISVNESQLSKWEKNLQSPRDDKVWTSLSEIFNVSLSYLMGISDEIDYFRDDEYITHDFNKEEYPFGYPMSNSRLKEKLDKMHIFNLQIVLADSLFMLSDDNMEVILKLAKLFTSQNIKGDVDTFFDETLQQDNFSTLRKALKHNRDKDKHK